MNIPQARLHLRALRWVSWLVFCGEVVSITGCVGFLWTHPGHLLPLLKTMLPVLFFWQVLPLIASRLAARRKQQVLPAGNHWQIGKYSEEQVRALIKEATADLPDRLRNPRIMIADRRGMGGWTWLSLLCPGWQNRKTIWITEGSLHYLETDELKALVLHETAHHVREYRHDIPGGWPLGDVALFCLLFWLGARLYLNAEGVFVIFFVVRAIVLSAAVRVLPKAAQTIEHLCDLYAAKKVGAGAMANVLLKMGEEEELVEAVLTRAARELAHVKGVEQEDLVSAFEDVRPHGRIFHDNLLRHASQVVAKVLEGVNPSARDRSVNRKVDAALRRDMKASQHRVRWRAFDNDGDSRLSDAEIRELCQALRDHPERTLFRCEGERNPATHPSYSARVLLLDAQGCFTLERQESGSRMAQPLIA